MLLEIFVGVFIYILFKYVFLPWRKYTSYGKILEKLGYKVYKHKFVPIVGGSFLVMKNNVKEHGDPFYFEKRLQGYDISITNLGV